MQGYQQLEFNNGIESMAKIRKKKWLALNFFNKLNSKLKRKGNSKEGDIYLDLGEGFEESLFDLSDKQFETKLIAYYLPQFYPFKENDGWWGKGFTEWRTVTRARSRFEGHYQPRLPRDLGYYDLRLTETMGQQIEIAKRFGIHGFCFYYYWFSGKKVLDNPVQNFLENKQLKMPFCLLWVNESWERRWGNSERETLIKQEYKEEDDGAMLADWVMHFKDKRYIKVNDQPIIIIYRPYNIPSTKSRIDKWRKILKNEYDITVKIIMSCTGDHNTPKAYGMDAALEFPPHQYTGCLPRVFPKGKGYSGNFDGKIYKYSDLIKESLKRINVEEPLLKCIVPSWDNDARNPDAGLGYLGSTPALYQSWLEELILYSKDNKFCGESLVFINAWNEWAEGAYLEPDIYWGSAYLNSTAKALLNTNCEHGNNDDPIA